MRDLNLQSRGENRVEPSNGDVHQPVSPSRRAHPQEDEPARSHALIAALSQVAAQLEEIRQPEAIIELLGTELCRLNLQCAIFELIPGERAVIMRHHTFFPEAVALVERLAAIQFEDFLIPIEALRATETIDHQQPCFIHDLSEVFSAVFPSFPRRGIRQVLRLAGMGEDNRVVYLPLIVDGGLIGLLSIWGGDLFESDVPTMALFARQVGVALDNARLIQKAQDELRQRIEIEESLQASRLELQRRADGLTTMVDLARVVSSSLALNDVLSTVVKTLLHVTGAGGVTLSRWDRETGILETWVQERRDGLDFSDQPLTYNLNDYPASRIVLESREPISVYADDPYADPAETALMRSRDMKTLLMVPLAKGETTIGLVEIDDESHLEFSADDVRLCQAIAQQAALAIENARLHTETERQLWHQTVLRQVADVIYASLNHQEVLDRLAEQFAIAIDATSAYICTYDADTLTSTVIAEYIQPTAAPAEKESDLYCSYTYPEYGEFLKSMDTHLYHSDDSFLSPDERRHLLEYGCKSIMIVPLQLRGKVSAFIELWESRERRNFTPDEQNLCKEIAQQAAIAIENANLYDEVQQRLREQTVINEAAEIILDSLDLSDVASRLAERLCSALDATSAYFCLCDRKSRNLTVIAEYVSPHASPQESVSDLGATYPDDDLSYQDTLQKSSLFVEHFDDPQLKLANRDHMRRYGVKSVIFIPLNQIGQDSLGVLEVWETRRRREFSPGELRLCRAISRQATIAIEKARLYAKAQQEINQRTLAQEKLKRSELDYRGLFENAHDPVIIFDPERALVLEVNQRACEVYGYSRSEMVNISLERIDKELQVDKNHLQQILESGRFYNYQTVHSRKDGSEMHVEVNLSLVHYQGRRAIQSINRDVTERLRAEEQLRYEAFHDRLTGLPNRALFTDRLEHTIARLQSRRRDTQFAVLFLDLDRFKNVNDSRGHSLGDVLLVEVARRLGGCVRTTDTVARLGGDEFVVLMEDIGSILDATAMCGRIKEQLDLPADLGGEPVFTSASIGVVLSDPAYHTPEEYLRDADIAMYRAKNGGRGRFEVFDTTMREHIMRRLALESDMRRAIREQEFVLHYMPIYSLRERELTGFEALLRWQHQEKGLLYPADFIEVAEETGMIVPIGRWVLQEATQQMETWRVRHRLENKLRMSLNLSGEQLNQPDLVDQVRIALGQSGLPPDCLSLEVTESALIKDVETAISTLAALKSVGVSLQLDDFGTGYSSLSYLRQFPIDAIKIDRSFILKGTVEANAPDLVRTIVLMGHELGLDVIAEGIETDEQMHRLDQLGCAQGQGFLFSRAVDAPQAERFLMKRDGSIQPE